MAQSLANNYPQVVQHFIQLAAQFDVRMGLPENANKVIQNAHPSPIIAGFTGVPQNFRPMVYKLIEKSMNLDNFTLDVIFSPEFEMIYEQPQLIILQANQAQMQTDITNIQDNQAQMQTDITNIQAGVNAILQRLDIPLI
jgi:hypothetical protein